MQLECWFAYNYLHYCLTPFIKQGWDKARETAFDSCSTWLPVSSEHFAYTGRSLQGPLVCSWDTPWDWNGVLRTWGWRPCMSSRCVPMSSTTALTIYMYIIVHWSEFDTRGPKGIAAGEIWGSSLWPNWTDLYCSLRHLQTISWRCRVTLQWASDCMDGEQRVHTRSISPPFCAMLEKGLWQESVVRCTTSPIQLQVPCLHIGRADVLAQGCRDEGIQPSGSESVWQSWFGLMSSWLDNFSYSDIGLSEALAERPWWQSLPTFKSREWRRPLNVKEGISLKHPHWSTTDDIECFFSVL